MVILNMLNTLFGWFCALLSCRYESIEKLLKEHPEVFQQFLVILLAGFVLFRFWREAKTQLDKTQLDMDSFLFAFSAIRLTLLNFSYLFMQVYTWIVLLKAAQSVKVARLEGKDEGEGVVIALALLLFLLYVWLELVLHPPVEKTKFDENPPIARMWVYFSKVLPNLFKVPKKNSFVTSAAFLVKLLASALAFTLIYGAWSIFKVIDERLVFPLFVAIAGIIWLCSCSLISRIYYFSVLIWAWVFVYLMSGLVTLALALYT